MWDPGGGWGVGFRAGSRETGIHDPRGLIRTPHLQTVSRAVAHIIGHNGQAVDETASTAPPRTSRRTVPPKACSTAAQQGVSSGAWPRLGQVPELVSGHVTVLPYPEGEACYDDSPEPDRAVYE
jgi:hypothetical protein